MRARTLLLIPLATALLYACDEHAEIPTGYADVVLSGTVTDEALVAYVGALDQGAPANAPSKAATLDSPAEGAALPKSPAATFSWHTGMTAGAPGWGRAGFALAEGDKGDKGEGGEPALRLLAPQAARPGLLIKPLRELFGPIRSAYAHGDPFTGTATFLVFSTDDNPKLLRVLTSASSYAPDAAAWGKLTAAGKPIKLTLTSADFENNRVLQGGGPFAGSSITFTITP